MKVTRSKLLLISMFVGFFLVTATVVFSAEQKPVTLKWAEPGPPAGVFEKADQWFASEITKRTQGKVKFDFFWSGTLLKYQDMITGVGSGVADFGQGAGLFTPNLHPYWTTLNQVGTGSDSWVMQWASYEMIHNNPEIKAEFDKLNLVPTYGYGPGEEVFIFKKPATKLEDFKGLRFRTYGEAFPKVVAKLGMVPVNLPLTDVYESLDRGVIDGAFAAIVRAYAMKWGEVAKYWSESAYNQDCADVTVVINKKTWNSLSEETRKIISEVAREYNDYVQKSLIEAEKQERSDLMASGVQFLKFSPEVDKIYVKAARDASEDWFAKHDSKGMKTKAVFEQLMGYVGKYEKILKEKRYPWNR